MGKSTSFDFGRGRLARVGRALSASVLLASVFAVPFVVLASSPAGATGSAAKYQVTVGSLYVYSGNSTLDEGDTTPSVNTVMAQLEDSSGLPVATSGLVVTWTSNDAGITFSSGTSTTNSNGVAFITFTTSTAYTGTPVSAHITATDTNAMTGDSGLYYLAALGPDATCSADGPCQYLVSYSASNVLAGSTVTVMAQYADGNGIPWAPSTQTITWTASPSGGSFPGTTTTDGNGNSVVLYTTSATSQATQTVTVSDGTTLSLGQNGTGPASFATISVPGAPTAVTPTVNSGVAFGGTTSVAVAWTAPATGGSPITGYTVEYSTSSGSGYSAFAGCTNTLTNPCNVTGLTAGTPYYFEVEAINAVGTGALSTASSAATPATVPDAPTGVTPTNNSGVAFGGNPISVAWTAPATGGSAITGYTVEFSTSSGSGYAPATGCTNILTNPCTITGGLTVGTPYFFKVEAINAEGTGALSAASSSVTPATAPDAPSGVTPTNNAGTVFGGNPISVAWTAPATGGSAITGYTVEFSTSSGSGYAPATGCTNILTNPCTITGGLTVGTAYYFEVEALNAMGTGALSGASSSATPATVPAAPVISSVANNAGVAFGGTTSIAVAWSAPATGGSAITGYTVQWSLSSGGSYVNASASCVNVNALTCNATGLTAGTPYFFKVEAINAEGTGALSSPSSSDTPATKPDAPTGVAASTNTGVAYNGTTSVAVSWTAPSTGGSAITGYTVEDSSGSGYSAAASCTNTGSSPCNVTGLTAGTAYTFEVEAINAEGTGALSSPSSSDTPATKPDAPTGVAASTNTGVAYNGTTSVAVSWTAPSTGGSAITGYTVEDSSGSGYSAAASCTNTGSSPCNVTGLTAGTAYTFEVEAINAEGTGALSGPSSSNTPATKPDATSAPTPTVVSQTSVSVAFSPPATGGSAITDYYITAADAVTPGDSVPAHDCSSTSSPCVVSDLFTGQTYTFTIAAANAEGTGSYSSASSGVLVNGAASTVSVSNIDPVTPAANGTSVTITATVGAGQTGNVTFEYSTDGVTYVAVTGCTNPALIGGTTASCVTTALPSGTVGLEAVYDGDATYATTTSSAAAYVVNAADGTGALVTSSPTNTLAGSTGNSVVFTYTAAAGGLNSGAITVAVPAGWSAPSITGTDPGDTTSTCGTVGVSSQTITVSGVTLASLATCTITYGDQTTGPGAHAQASSGTASFAVREQSTSGGALGSIAAATLLVLNAADATGTIAVTSPASVLVSSSGNTVVFTYTAAAGGLNAGAITVVLPAGWSAPSTTTTDAGYTTSTCGTVGAASQTVTVSAVTLTSGATCTITYGSTAGTGPGATVQPSSGTASFAAQEKSTSGGALGTITAATLPANYGADGTGQIVLTSPSSVIVSETGVTAVFTYTAATGGLNAGAITVVVPADWSAPSVTGTDSGYTTSTCGTVGVSGQTITVSSVTMAAAATCTITFGSTASAGPGAVVQPGEGTASFVAQEKSTAGGTLTSITTPSLSVANGGGGTTTGPPVAVAPAGIAPGDLGTPVSSTASSSVTTTVTTTSGTSSSSLSVPAGALPEGTTVSTYPVTNTSSLVSQVPAGSSYVVAFAVAWTAPDGTSPTATAPITMTISDPSIKAGDTIYEVTALGLVAVGTATVDGSVSVTFSNDPVFMVTGKSLTVQAALTLTTTSGVVGTALSLVTSGGSGTGVVTFTVTNGTATGCTISGSSLSATAAGTCVVTATKTADATYQAVSSSATTVTFALTALVAQSALTLTTTSGVVGTALSLATSGGSGTGAVSFTVTNGTATGCTITSGALSASSSGTCLVTATKAADATYTAVNSVATTVTMAKAIAKPTVAKPAPIDVSFGFYASSLTNATKDALINLSRKIVRGASVTITGYALKELPLAKARAKAVEVFLLKQKKVHVTLKFVTTQSIRKVKVVVTAV